MLEQTSVDQASLLGLKRLTVAAYVEHGHLPPEALNTINPNGTIDDRDVVRTELNGTRGKKLVWDLDQNGKIDESERTITERELYDATLGIH